MALPIDGFITPEQDFGSLEKMGDQMEKRREKAEFRKQQDAARKSASDKYFTNYLDPKDRFTGTMVDPVNNELLGKALKQAYELSADGANDNEILAAIQPLVTKVNNYTTKAKIISGQKKAYLETLSKRGIDKGKFGSEFDDEVWMTTDESGNRVMKDPSTIDPSENYADKVLKNRNVFNNEGFRDYVADAGKHTIGDDVAIYNSNGSMRRTKVDVTKPSFMVSDKDARGAHIGFVPKYEIAIDGENVIMHDFLGDKGEKVKAPVRMVTDDIFDDLPKTAQAYLLQEVREYAKSEGVEVSTTQAHNLAKALAYNEIKNEGKQFSTMKEIQVQKAAPAPVTRITVNNNTSSTVPVNDVEKGIFEKVTDHKDFEKYPTQMRSQVNGKVIVGGTPANTLDDQETEVVMAKVKAAGYGDLDISEVYLVEKDGRVTAFKADDDKAITSITRIGANIGKQAGVKPKTAVVSEGNRTPPVQQKAAPAAKSNAWDKYKRK